MAEQPQQNSNDPFDFSEFGIIESFKRLIRDTADCLRFLSRLPLFGNDEAAHQPPDFRRAARAVPIAGAIIGSIGAIVVFITLSIGLSPFLSVTLAVAALILTTGAFHEDGLADTADGIGGGQTRLQKLEIMRDSRIGTYGTAAFTLALLIRIGALTQLASEATAWRVALVVIAAEAISRVGGVALTYAVRPARVQGSAFATGRPSGNALYEACVYAAIIAVITSVGAAGFLPTFIGLIAAGAATIGMITFTRAKLGGQTGDVAGATQQVVMLAFLVALLIFI